MSGCSAVLTRLEPAMIPLLVLLVIPACMFVSKEDLPGRPDTEGTGPSDSDSDPITPQTWYADADGDGYGDPNQSQQAEAMPEHYVADRTDCDDTNPQVYPGADEICDEVDQDCDQEIDEDPVDGLTWYADVDGDGYGDSGTAFTGCTAPDGAVADDTDCDDTDGNIHPAAEEICVDTLDQDCNGVADDLCWSEGTIADTEANLILVGTTESLHYGSPMASGGDLTGDGVPDIATMEPNSATIYVYHGSSTGTVSVGPSTAAATIEDTGGTDKLAVHGDRDGTGDDLLSAVAPGGPGVGYLFDGPLLGAVGTKDWSWNNSGPGGLAWGDVDDDGRDDVLTGSYGVAWVLIFTDQDEYGTSDTADVIIHGARTSSTTGTGPYFAGWDVDSGRDFTGDGLQDVVVGGAYGLSVIEGPLTASLYTSTYALELTDSTLLEFGQTNELIPDVDGDGVDDLVTCADGRGAWLFPGGTEGSLGAADANVTLTTDGGDNAGLGVTGADVNADGRADLILGGYNAIDGGEAGFIFLSPASGSYTTSDADNAVTVSSGGYFGYNGLARVGAVDDFGYEAFAATNSISDLGATDGGAVFLFHGPR